MEKKIMVPIHPGEILMKNFSSQWVLLNIVWPKTLVSFQEELMRLFMGSGQSLLIPLFVFLGTLVLLRSFG